MNHFLDEVFLDNSIRSYLISAGIIGGTLLFRRLLAKACAWLIARLITSKNKPFDAQRFNELVQAPIDMFLLVWAVIIAFNRLNMPEALKFSIYKSEFHDIMESLARAVLIGCFMWLCNRIIMYIAHLLHQKAIATEDRTDDQLVIFFSDFMKVIVWIIGILLILKFSFGFDLNNVLTGLSIVGAALALAFRESLENLIASFIIFFDKPFTIGDIVKVESITGTVEKIGLRSTRIRTAEKTFATMPNKKMVDSILDNQTLRTQRNVLNRIEISMKTPAQVVANYIAGIENILQQPHVLDSNVFLADTGVSANIIHVEYFVDMEPSMKEFFKLREKVNLQILTLAAELHIEMAAESRAITLRQQ
ncbi:MAG TPA: mechanosensitive ion channel domain-containing protein [Phnomibacter sp.]|nr:mechanosensitive ion channel domain-containing protein [Phnomibacter sp.]